MKRYFDRNGQEIREGMTIYLGDENSGVGLPIRKQDGKLGAYVTYPKEEFIPLNRIDFQESVIMYVPQSMKRQFHGKIPHTERT